MSSEQCASTVSPRIRELARCFHAGEIAALAQSITMVEDGGQPLTALLRLLSDSGAAAPRVGFTGPPGVGKSTLVDAMVGVLRAGGRSVGVLAVDPSSPFTRGALLGDRVRLSGHSLDPGVFIRSMGARGYAGGLSMATADALWLMSAFGLDEVIVETVGVGQSELALPSVVDTTVVVVPPDAGDRIQVQKAGIMEIADIFVVNKADLNGASRMVSDLRSSVRLRASSGWRPLVVATVANRLDDSHAVLWEAIESHRRHLATSPASEGRAVNRLSDAVVEMVAGRVRAWARGVLAGDEDLRRTLKNGGAPQATAQHLMDLLTVDTQNRP